MKGFPNFDLDLVYRRCKGYLITFKSLPPNVEQYLLNNYNRIKANKDFFFPNKKSQVTQEGIYIFDKDDVHIYALQLELRTLRIKLKKAKSRASISTINNFNKAIVKSKSQLKEKIKVQTERRKIFDREFDPVKGFPL